MAEGEMSATDIVFYSSKVPIKFTTVPLNIILDLVLKTNMKLNLKRGKISLINDIETVEYHSMRIEGNIKESNNSV